MKQDYRLESDSMGSVKVPSAARYGAQTQRALDNFTIPSAPMPSAFIRALIIIKAAAAEANVFLGSLDCHTGRAIVEASERLLGENFIDHFPVPVLQTGSGTSTNMNVNEVLSFMAGCDGLSVLPNDHVNMSQSSNDVIPSAMYISSALAIKDSLLPAFSHLVAIINNKSVIFSQLVKTGRTHLMDAVPIRFTDELDCWASQIDDCAQRFSQVLEKLAFIPLGGTAVGNGLNCPPGFPEKAIAGISQRTGFGFVKAASSFKGQSSIDLALEVSSHLKTAACALMKIANDLRWMNSGPITGFGEITLPPLQPGSSIMPDKVNPVIPESICMAAAQVIGNDSAITIAAQASNFQLNTMFPLTAAKLLESIELLAGSALALGEKAIRDMTVNEKRMTAVLDQKSNSRHGTHTDYRLYEGGGNCQKSGKQQA